MEASLYYLLSTWLDYNRWGQHQSQILCVRQCIFRQSFAQLARYVPHA